MKLNIEIDTSMCPGAQIMKFNNMKLRSRIDQFKFGVIDERKCQTFYCS